MSAAPEQPSPDDLEVVIGPMRRRHLRGVLKIEQQVYPRPWSLGLFMSELAYEESRVYLTARLGGTVVGYGGLMCVLEDGHVTTIAVDPRWHRYRSEEHTSELQSLMRISYAVFCLKKKNNKQTNLSRTHI